MSTKKKRVTIKEEKFPYHRDCTFNVFIGNPGSGKTTLAHTYADSMYEKGVRRFFVYAADDSVAASWIPRLKGLFVKSLMGKPGDPHNYAIDSAIEHLRNLMMYQTNKVKRLKLQFMQTDHDDDFVVPEEHRVCIICDDTGAEPRFNHSKPLKQLAKIYRHLGIEFGYCAHRFNDLHKDTREKPNRVFHMKTKNEESYQIMFKLHVGDAVMSYKTFRAVFHAIISTKGQALAVDNTRDEDIVFYVKSRYPVSNYMLCSEKGLDYHNRHYVDKDMIQPPEDDDMKQLMAGPIHHKTYTHSLVSLKNQTGNQTETVHKFESKNETFEVALVELDEDN